MTLVGIHHLQCKEAIVCGVCAPSSDTRQDYDSTKFASGAKAVIAVEHARHAGLSILYRHLHVCCLQR